MLQKCLPAAQKGREKTLHAALSRSEPHVAEIFLMFEESSVAELLGLDRNENNWSDGPSLHEDIAGKDIRVLK